MPSSVPPPDPRNQPAPVPSTSTSKSDSFEKHVAGQSGGGGGGMTEFMKQMSPEDRKKFMNILVQNLNDVMKKSSEKMVEELKKEREQIQSGE